MVNVLLTECTSKQMATDAALLKLVDYEVQHANQSGIQTKTLTANAIKLIILSSAIIFISAFVIGFLPEQKHMYPNQYYNNRVRCKFI